MGSPTAPHLANGWMSQFDTVIKGTSKIFTHYMDDILQEMKTSDIETKLVEINNLHPNLTFTIEKQIDDMIPFLDMKIIKTEGNLSSTWHSKPTNTGWILNYNPLAPRHYKKSVVSVYVHRIVRACSKWHQVHDSL